MLVTVRGPTVATGASAPSMALNWMGWTRWDRFADGLVTILSVHPESFTVTSRVSPQSCTSPPALCMPHREHSGCCVPLASVSQSSGGWPG